jgi:hypothetical protein
LYEPAAWKNMGRLVGVHPDRPVSAEAVVAISMTLNAELQSSARAASRFCLFCRNRSQHIAQRFPASTTSRLPVRARSSSVERYCPRNCSQKLKIFIPI